MNKHNKPLRWYKITDDEYSYIIASYSHNAAKWAYDCMISAIGNYWEVVNYYGAKLVKGLPTEPTTDGETFDDIQVLLKLGIYKYCWDGNPCPVCGATTDESNFLRYNKEKDSFYCEVCKDNP